MPSAVAGLLFFSAFALVGQEPSLSQAKADALGRALAADQVKRTPPIVNATVEGFVAQLTERLGIANQVTAHLVSDDSCAPVHEPRAFPGGQVFVSTALLAEARDMSEVAAMLAHAAFHAAEGVLRHSGAIPLVFVGGNCSDMVLPLAVKPRQEELEREADRQAVERLAGAGFDSSAVARYLERRLPKNASTDERLAALAAVVATVGSRVADPALETAFAAAQAETQRLRTEKSLGSGPPSLRRKRP